MKEKDSVSWDLLVKSFTGKLTDEQERQLCKWLAKSERHRRFYYSALSGGVNVVEGLSDEELRRRRIELRQRLNLQSGRKMRRRFVYYAAAVAVPVALLAGLILKNDFGNYAKTHDPFEKNVELAANILPGKSKAVLILDDGREMDMDGRDGFIEVGEMKITTNGGELSYEKSHGTVGDAVPVINKLKIPKGGEYALMLADGSKIWLNSESIIEYSIQFTNDKREVFLRGEAYFDVAKDLSRPFIVRTDDFTAKVTGTTFNINSYDDLNSSSITVETGSVQVLCEDGEIARLGQCQQLSIDRVSGLHTMQNVDVEMVVAWKNGYFYFEMEPLELIAKRISRWYDIETVISSDALAKTRFSGKIVKYEIAAKILELLTLTGDITYEVKDNTIILSPLNKQSL